MKADIHPKYKETVIKCVCGNEVKIGSTTDDQTVEICAMCHPYYTGNQKLVDSRGRIDKFEKRMKLAKQ